MNYTFIIVYMYYVTEWAKFCQCQNFPFVRCCQSDNSDKTNKRDRITNAKVRSLCFYLCIGIAHCMMAIQNVLCITLLRHLKQGIALLWR